MHSETERQKLEIRVTDFGTATRGLVAEYFTHAQSSQNPLISYVAISNEQIENSLLTETGRVTQMFTIDKQIWQSTFD